MTATQTATTASQPHSSFWDSHHAAVPAARIISSRSAAPQGQGIEFWFGLRSAVMAAIPDLAGVDSAIEVWSAEVHKEGMITFYNVTFTSDMNEEGIRDIFQALVLRGKASIKENNMHHNCGIVFQAEFASGSPELATLLLNLGWEALLVLPRAWNVKCIWDYLDHPTLAKIDRDGLAESASVVNLAAGEEQHRPPTEYLTCPKLTASAKRLDEQFPGFGIIDAWPRVRPPVPW